MMCNRLYRLIVAMAIAVLAGNSPWSAREAWAQTASAAAFDAAIVGTYVHSPVQNAWHEGTITRSGTQFRWTNKAGASWLLTPDYAAGVLRTAADNPYHEKYPHLRAFKLVIVNGYLQGFDFGGVYKRSAPVLVGAAPAQAAAPAPATGAAPAARPVPAPDPTGHTLATRFAPILLYDRAAASYGFPMSAQTFYQYMQAGDPRLQHESSPGIKNVDPNTLTNGSIPTYYQVLATQRQIRIKYWWFYGMQEACRSATPGIPKTGRHHADWEAVTVVLTEDRAKVAAVTLYQHNNHYTRIAGPRDAPCTPGGTGRCGGKGGFELAGVQPVIYVEKISHGAFHDRNSAGPGGCGYHDGFRNPANPPLRLDANRRLVSLQVDSEPWITDARQGKIERWGPKDSTPKEEGAISTNPVKSGPTYQDRACDGSPTWLLKSAGCYKSECLAGDDQASEDCLKECRPGYDNAGLTCNKGKWPWEWDIYGRLTGGNKYSYNYVIPSGDSGLSRRRVAGEPW